MPELETELMGGDWVDLLKGKLASDEYLNLQNIPNTNILSAIVLVLACGKTRARAHLANLRNEYGIMPEINEDGERRCCFISDKGKRCVHYAKIPVCEKHTEYAMTYSNFLQSPGLRKSYESLLKDPQRMQLDAEQAVMRLMLTEVLKKIDEGSVPLELVSGITVLCEKISQVTERAAKISAITPEMVEKMLDQVVVILEKYVPPDKLSAAADEIDNIKPRQIISNIEYVPGDKIVHNGEEKDIKIKKMEAVIEKLIETQMNMG
jgi:hypothetical protein